MLEKLFGTLPVQQSCDDHHSDRDTSALDPRAASADSRIGHDIGMCYRRHGESLANLSFPCNQPPTLTHWRYNATAWPSSCAWVETQLGLEGQGDSCTLFLSLLIFIPQS